MEWCNLNMLSPFHSWWMSSHRWYELQYVNSSITCKRKQMKIKGWWQNMCMPRPLVGSHYIDVRLWISEVHNITMQLYHGVFSNKTCCVPKKKSTAIYNCLLKSSHYMTWVFPVHMEHLELKENYAHVIPGPTRRSQGVVQCYICWLNIARKRVLDFKQLPRIFTFPMDWLPTVGGS